MIDRWIFATFPSTLRDLSVYRIIYSVAAFVLYIPTGTWLNNAPDAFFSPPAGIAAIVGHSLPIEAIAGLNMALACSLTALLFGWHTRIASLLTFALILTLNSWVYAYGKINHDILFVIVPIVFAFSGWGRFYSLDSKGEADDTSGAWAVTLMATLIGIALFTAGWAKLGWLATGSHSFQGTLVSYVHILERSHVLNTAYLQVPSRVFWEAHDYLVVVFELAALPAIVSRRSFWFLCAVATIFHLGVLILLGISFWFNIVAYAAVVPWAKLNLVSFPRLRHLWAIALAIIVWSWIRIAISIGDPFVELSRGVGSTVIFAGACAGLWYLTSQLVRPFASPPTPAAEPHHSPS